MPSRSHTANATTFVSDASAGDLLEITLVTAVATVLAIRAYLEATGYPQIGGKGFHIAHLLWGGLLMLIAIVLLIAYLGGRVRRLAAIVGGIGFGLFIDELGKFITSDNDYFYRPAIAIIYMIFMSLFLLLRAFERRSHLSPTASLLNALSLFQDAALHRLEAADRDRIATLLAGADSRNPLVPALASLLPRLNDVAPPVPDHAERLYARLQRVYYRVVRARHLDAAMLCVFLVAGASTLADSLLIVSRRPGFGRLHPVLSFLDIVTVGAAMAVVALIGVGLVAMRRDRVRGYGWLKRAMIVSVCVANPFAFSSLGLLALGAMLRDLLLLGALDYILHHPEPAGRSGVHASQLSATT